MDDSDDDSDAPPVLIPIDEAQEHNKPDDSLPQATQPLGGAGKSTLVQNILTEKHGFRVAVILNEVGNDRGIEKAMLQNEDGEVAKVNEWVELTNGCLCCSVKDDFVNALESLMLQQAIFDYILIETTGLADPGPVAAALWTDEQLESGVVLDCIVTVVDAKNIKRQLAGNRDVPSEPAVSAGGDGQVESGRTILPDQDTLPLRHTEPAAMQSTGREPLLAATPQPQHVQDSAALSADVHAAVSSDTGAGVNNAVVPVHYAPDVRDSGHTSASHSEPSSAATHILHAQPGGASSPASGDPVRSLEAVPAPLPPAGNHHAPTHHATRDPHQMAAAVNEAQKQIAYADVILLNKTDLVSVNQLAVVSHALRKHNSAAEIVPCQSSRVPLQQILNTGAYRGLAPSLDVAASHMHGDEHSHEDACRHCGHSLHDGPEGHHCSHGDHGHDGASEREHHGAKQGHYHHHHGEHKHEHTQHIGHDPDVSTVTLRLSKPVSLEGFHRWMDTLLWDTAKTVDIFRIKGLLDVRDSNLKHGVQAVHELYEVVKGGEWGAGEDRSTRIVVIGRFLDKAAMQSSLTAACLPHL